ncbi:MAG: PEP-CTERM sorting domain-containing protein [Roseibacillus sp.]
MKNQKNPVLKTLILPLTLVSVGASNSNAAITITPAFTVLASPPTVSNTDLAQTAVSNPTVDITAVSGDTLGAGTRRLGLFNGAVGDSTQNTNEADYVRVVSGDTLSIDFDVTTNTLGYDITGITSVFNWGDRADQGFSVDIDYVGGTTATLLAAGFWGDQNPQNGTTQYSIVTIANTGGGALNNDTFTFGGTTTAGTSAVATGVESITFTFNNLRNPSVAGEIDIFGVATVPEPSSALLLGLAGMGFLVRRRK